MSRELIVGERVLVNGDDLEIYEVDLKVGERLYRLKRVSDNYCCLKNCDDFAPINEL